MSHVILSAVDFTLWAFASNLMFFTLVLALKQVSGSALLFTAGIACFTLLLALGIRSHADTALSFPYAVMTLPLCIGVFGKRIKQYLESKSIRNQL